MSRNWNGEALVNEISSFLGDNSTVFKSRVEGWLNDTLVDIASRFDWGYYLVKGKNKINPHKESHSLEVVPPESFSIEALDGGSLTLESAYSVLLTYVQSNKVESVSGYESETVTITGTNLSLRLSELPTSNESMVVARNVYLKKDDGDYFFHSQIDNSVSELIITSNTTSKITPPDHTSIRKIKGNLYTENPSGYIRFKDEEQIRLIIQGKKSLGTPEFFSPLGEDTVLFYPIPNRRIEVCFDYYRYPHKLVNSKASTPDIPLKFKLVLKAGVVALGYEFRDRDGQETKRANYEALLRDAISRFGHSAEVEYTVRDVYGYNEHYEAD